MQWYKHDANAHGDAKLRRVRMKYGMAGYGLYWYCLELIAANVEAHNLTFELEHDAEIIAHDTGINYELVQEMMTYMVDLGLFEQDRGIITCRKMLKRLDQSMTSSPKMRKLIEAAKAENHDGVMTNHDGVMIPPDSVMQEENRREENRRDKNRKKRIDTHGRLVAAVREFYPKRAGNQPWKKAGSAINARLNEGHDLSEIVEGAKRYAAFCDATNKTGTQFVMQAATFCGPDKHFLETWEAPKSSADVRQDKNVAAALKFLESANE